MRNIISILKCIQPITKTRKPHLQNMPSIYLQRHSRSVQKPVLQQMTLPKDEPYCPYCSLRIYVGRCGCSEWQEIEHSLVLVKGPPAWLRDDYDKRPLDAKNTSLEDILSRLSAVLFAQSVAMLQYC